MMNDNSNTKGMQANSKDVHWSAPILWIIGLVINGFVIYLWWIFGSAAAAGADTTVFLSKTAAGVSVSVLGSLAAFLFQRIALGIILIWAMFPIVICFFNPSWLFWILF